MKKLLKVVFFTLILVITGCGDDSTSPPDINGDVRVEVFRGEWVIRITEWDWEDGRFKPENREVEGSGSALFIINDLRPEDPLPDWVRISLWGVGSAQVTYLGEDRPLTRELNVNIHKDGFFEGF